MSPIIRIRRLILECLDLLGDYEMLKAQVDRLAKQSGISLEIPDRPGVEVTPEIRAYILEAREQYSEEEWLLNKGIRDQICVRFGLSRSQIAGILSAASRRNGNGVGHSTLKTVLDPEACPDNPKITADPATWPTDNGSGENVSKPIRRLNETDWQIAEVVIAAGEWEQKRWLIRGHRGLTGQQVAGMKAVLSRRTS